MFIDNQATAALYVYTPYRPNAAALGNMYGTGDSCSSYGNRNFWRMFSDWFGNPTSGGFLAKSANDPAIYLLSGITKYRVPSMEVYSALFQLGSYRVVDPSYLNLFATSAKPASDLIRDPASGAIFLAQGGSKDQFPSCQMIDTYGYSCAEAIDLTPAQLARYSTGGAMAPFFVESGTPTVYFLANATKRPVIGWTTVVTLNGGQSPFVATLRPGKASVIPAAAPVVAPNSLVKETSDPTVYFVDGLGSKVQLSSFAIAGELGSSGYTTVADGALVGYVTAEGFLSLAVRCGVQMNVASGGSLVAWQTTDAAGLSVTDLTADACARIPKSGGISGQLFVKSLTSDTVFIVQGGMKRALNWNEFAQLSGGGSARIITLAPDTMATMLTVRVLINSGTLAKSASSDAIYFIDTDRRIYVGSFTTTSELGISQWKSYADPDVTAYALAAGSLTRTVTCNKISYFAAGGRLYPLASTNPHGLPKTDLTAASCSTLSLVSQAPLDRIFVKVPESDTVYQILGGTRKPVKSWTDLLVLNAGVAPQVLVAGRGGLSDIPIG